MVSPVKRHKEINGYKLGSLVKIIVTSHPEMTGSREIRLLGIAGFYVKELSTCFYWHEKKTTWDDP